MKILIDNGHGLMTAGKRSPDGLFREPFYNREIASRVVSDLRDRGLEAELLVPEDEDIYSFSSETPLMCSNSFFLKDIQDENGANN